MSNAGSVVDIKWPKVQNFIHFSHYEAQPPGADGAGVMHVWREPPKATDDLKTLFATGVFQPHLFEGRPQNMV